MTFFCLLPCVGHYFYPDQQADPNDSTIQVSKQSMRQFLACIYTVKKQQYLWGPLLPKLTNLSKYFQVTFPAGGI